MINYIKSFLAETFNFGWKYGTAEIKIEVLNSKLWYTYRIRKNKHTEIIQVRTELPHYVGSPDPNRWVSVNPDNVRNIKL